MISVLIVDDHTLVIEGIKTLLQDAPGISYVGHATSAGNCRGLLAQLRPDVVLLDINLPDENGIDLCAEITQEYPTISVLALTTYNQETTIRKMMDSGALGYILKNVTCDELSTAIHTVYEGKTFLSFDVAKTLQNSSSNDPLVPVLTRREKEVLMLIAEGFNTKEIAARLFVGSTTVDTYRKNLLVKLNARNTAMLIRMAVVHKLIELN